VCVCVCVCEGATWQYNEPLHHVSMGAPPSTPPLPLAPFRTTVVPHTQKANTRSLCTDRDRHFVLETVDIMGPGSRGGNLCVISGLFV